MIAQVRVKVTIEKSLVNDHTGVRALELEEEVVPAKNMKWLKAVCDPQYHSSVNEWDLAVWLARPCRNMKHEAVEKERYDKSGMKSEKKAGPLIAFCN